MQSASTFDTASENFYHGTVFGMLAILSDWYYISSNRESGEGRFDVQLEPRDRTQMGYIIEFKAGKELSEQALSDTAGKAVSQIRRSSTAQRWSIVASRRSDSSNCVLRQEGSLCL